MEESPESLSTKLKDVEREMVERNDPQTRTPVRGGNKMIEES